MQYEASTSDQELIAGIAIGDSWALGELYLRHGTAILRFLSRTLGDVTAAEDLCQEVFLSLSKIAGNYRSPGNPRAWLFGVAANFARSYRRRQWVRNKIHQTYLFFSPDSEIITESTQDRLTDKIEVALARLTPEQREVLMLQVGEGLSGVEIAQILSLSHAAVRVRLHRAREALRDAVFGDPGVGSN